MQRDRSQGVMVRGAVIVGLAVAVGSLTIANRMAVDGRLGPARRRAGGVGEEDASPVPGAEGDETDGHVRYH